jgi:microcystin-dependent protein
MTEFYKGSIPCVIGQTVYQITHPKINDPLSFPFVSLSLPSSLATPLLIKGITNKTTVSFDVILDTAPISGGYGINWQINIPGTDVAEYVNDKRYYSKEEIGNAKLARVHWKNVIAAPDMSPNGLKNNHNHDNRYFTKSEITPVINSQINAIGSYNPLASTLAFRDLYGRTQFNTPKVNADAANKGYVDVKVSGEASARIATDMYLQSEIISISGSYATDVDAQFLQTQITLLESLIAGISASGFYSGGAVPVGTIIWRATTTGIGVDWGYCDGGSLAITSNNELFTVVGYTFGGSGNSFKKPDLRGEFIRGWDDGRGIDTGRTFGSLQIDDNKAHTHSTTVNSAGDHNHTISVDGVSDHNHGLSSALLASAGTTGTVSGSADINIYTTNATSTQSAGSHTHTASSVNAGGHNHSVTINSAGTESRPRNVALKPFIKLFTPIMIEPVNISTSQSISGQKTFIQSIILPALPQALIFGNPTTIGTKAIGTIAGQIAITMHVSAGVWTPIVWLG